MDSVKTTLGQPLGVRRGARRRGSARVQPPGPRPPRDWRREHSPESAPTLASCASCTFSVQTSSDSHACASTTCLIRRRAPRASAARSTSALSPSSGGLPSTCSPAHHLVVVNTEFRCVLLCYSTSRRFVLSTFYLSYFTFLVPFYFHIYIFYLNSNLCLA